MKKINKLLIILTIFVLIGISSITVNADEKQPETESQREYVLRLKTSFNYNILSPKVNVTIVGSNGKETHSVELSRENRVNGNRYDPLSSDDDADYVFTDIDVGEVEYMIFNCHYLYAKWYADTLTFEGKTYEFPKSNEKILKYRIQIKEYLYDSYISEVKFIVDNTDSRIGAWAYDNGYSYCPVDLNKDAGGDYIYMIYKTSTDKKDAITGIIGLYVEEDTSDHKDPNKTISKNDDVIFEICGGYSLYDGIETELPSVDLNKGIAGLGDDSYIYIYTTKNIAYDDPITYAFISTRSIEEGYNTVCQYQEGTDTDDSTIDLNKGVGGDYVYLHYTNSIKMVMNFTASAFTNNVIAICVGCVVLLGGGFAAVFIIIKKKKKASINVE